MKRVMVMLVMVLLCAASSFAGDSRFDVSRKVVEDKRTGLVWARSAGNGLLDWDGAAGLVATLNGKEFGGAKDWRLPSREELETLTTYARKVGHGGGLSALSPYKLFNDIGFEDIKPCWYWSSSAITDNPSSAWVVSMYDGNARGELKDGMFCVWPVRGGK